MRFCEARILMRLPCKPNRLFRTPTWAFRTLTYALLTLTYALLTCVPSKQKPKGAVLKVFFYRKGRKESAKDAELQF